MLIFVFRTSASDCLEDRLRNDLYSVVPFTVTHSLYKINFSSVLFSAIFVVIDHSVLETFLVLLLF